MRQKKVTADSLQPIDNSKTYALPTFMAASGMGRHALMHARRQGLKVIKLCGRVYVRGCDFSEFLGTLMDDSEVSR
ncbi:MAG: hypothetical protein WKF77_06250 [Planctomycetaceae bacterium]